MSNSRTDRLGELLRERLAEIMLTKLRDPRAQLATVTRVDVSGDLSYATIFLSFLGQDASGSAEGLAALEGAKGFLRTQLAARVRLRKMPELRFRLDHGAEHSARISDLLDRLLPAEGE